MEMRESGELLRDETIGAAGRHFSRKARLLLRLAPLGKYAWHDEPYRGQEQAAGRALGGVCPIAPRQLGIELGGQPIGGGGFYRVGTQFKPPLMAADNLAGRDAVAQRGDVKINWLPTVARANREEAIGDFLFSNLFAKGVQLAFRPSDPLQARRIKR